MFRGLFRKVTQIFQRRTKIDDALFEELEESLIEADVGYETALSLVTRLREAVRKERLATGEEAQNWLKADIERNLSAGSGVIQWAPNPPTLIMVVGVNGTGKTTSIAKLTHYFQSRGNRVILAAADTFRAGAIEQLQVWADRLKTDMIRHREGADPAAVVFDAVTAARARGADLVIADTAGRLHTKTNLMDELRKVNRVSERALGRSADEVLLVLDATIGQNAVQQARAFTDTLPITGIILTKLDGTARGGVVLSIRNELGIPIKFMGTGEKPTDIQAFNAKEFADAIFGPE